MRESALFQPCPGCDGASERLMPTQFAAFTFRDGYPRRLPDKGTYWRLGKEVSSPGNDNPFWPHRDDQFWPHHPWS